MYHVWGDTEHYAGSRWSTTLKQSQQRTVNISIKPKGNFFNESFGSMYWAAYLLNNRNHKILRLKFATRNTKDK
jgi:hypothetical protein